MDVFVEILKIDCFPCQEVETAVRFPDSDEELPDLPPVTPRGQKSASLSTSLSASLTTSLQPEKEVINKGVRVFYEDGLITGQVFPLRKIVNIVNS